MPQVDFGDLSVQPGQHEEGTFTKRIEHFTSQVPSGYYLTAGFAAAGLSAGLYLTGRRTDAQFVGHWVSAILLMGVYNKLVKLHGSD